MLSEKERKKVKALYVFTAVIALYLAGIAALQTYFVYFFNTNQVG